jgi:hypothetical protein
MEQIPDSQARTYVPVKGEVSGWRSQIAALLADGIFRALQGRGHRRARPAAETGTREASEEARRLLEKGRVQVNDQESQELPEVGE